MQKYRILLLVALIGLMACNKPETGNSALLEGTWKMTMVQDKTSGVQFYDPGNMGAVVIRFAAGKFSGKTPGNDIWPSNYTTGPANRLLVPVVGATKAGENAWGELFYTHMYTIENYSFKESNTLLIGTRQKLLNFERQ
jgi:hypothetical protein